MTRIAGLIAALAMLGLPAVALADPPSPDNQVGKEILGLVPPHNGAAKSGGSGGGLVYHGGPVVHGDKSIAIYWTPPGYSIASGYDTTINQFLGDVEHDNGLTTNVYFSDTQYYDGLGAIPYSSHFSGAITATNAFPTSGNCSDSVTATTICLTDAQLRTEIQTVLAGTTTDQNTVVFIFTPKNVGSCYSSSSCAFSSYCAYHSNLLVNGVRTLYANQPYTETAPSACGSGERPNGNDADSTINVVSHEHNEAITDPLGTAWYDRRGYENGDKCAWTWGTTSGASGSKYNQTINGHNYFLQQEWSNASSACVLQGT